MAFRVRQETHLHGEQAPNVWILEDEENPAGDRLEVCPGLGFNAYRWRDGGGNELLYSDPAFFAGARPTRSGWPILFPFPNRIRDGQFTWDGNEFRLVKNDPVQRNAIHGFTTGRPWRVIEHDGEEFFARLTAEFHSERDATDVRHLWPADFVLRVTYQLRPSGLRVEALVENPGPKPLPFGLGYHPYFRTAPFGGDQALIEIGAAKQWTLEDLLPSGATTAFSYHERPFAEVQLDHLLTDVPVSRPDARQCGAIESADGLRLTVLAARDFRELVVFTPPHRQAICFEPYTCITDAINLQQRGVDTGLLVLGPGESWQGWVEAMVSQDPTPAA